MPSGRLMRIDEDRRRAYVVRRGHSYEAELSEVETAARVPGARVSYKVRRREGVESATEVRLRRGTRTNKRQSRFGDLTGVRRDGTKGRTAGQQAYGIDVTTQPMGVALAWVEAMSAQDPDSALDLYLPSAVVHGQDGSASSHRQRQRLASVSTWLGVDQDDVTFAGLDRYIRADQPTADPPMTTYFFVEDGQITEQWLDEGPELPADEAPTGPVDVLTKGPVPAGAVDHANDRLARVVDSVGCRIHHGRMKLSAESNPTVDRPNRVQISVDTGTTLRVHAAEATMVEAIDVAIDRLRNKLEHDRDWERHNPTGLPTEPGQWRHGNRPTPFPPYFDRPIGEREVVRHKSFAPEEMTVEEAVADLHLLDYDFFLFVELETGRDCLLELEDGGDHVLHALGPGGADETTIAVPSGVRPSSTVAPRLRPSQAVEFLDAAGHRFLFFANALSGRGNVIYRRYDGHYGLITPSDEDE